MPNGSNGSGGERGEFAGGAVREAYLGGTTWFGYGWISITVRSLPLIVSVPKNAHLSIRNIWWVQGGGPPCVLPQRPRGRFPGSGLVRHLDQVAVGVAEVEGGDGALRAGAGDGAFEGGEALGGHVFGHLVEGCVGEEAEVG